MGPPPRELLRRCLGAVPPEPRGDGGLGEARGARVGLEDRRGVDDGHLDDRVAPLVLGPRVLDAAGVLLDAVGEGAEEALTLLLLLRGLRRAAEAQPGLVRAVGRARRRVDE